MLSIHPYNCGVGMLFTALHMFTNKFVAMCAPTSSNLGIVSPFFAATNCCVVPERCRTME